MNTYYSDFHVHIGKASSNMVKIAASASLTLKNILDECLRFKGIDIVGIIDSMSPCVLNEISGYLKNGMLHEMDEGGFRYLESVTFIPGAEIEAIYNGKPSHCLCYFPGYKQISMFCEHMKNYIRNINLSSQNCHISPYELLKIVVSYDGIMIPAHIFTPYKSLYGACTDRIAEVFGEKYDSIYGVELGLSSDSDMADMLSELKNKSFLSSSDAHSLLKIGREFNVLRLDKPNFSEIVKALKRENGRNIEANYGLNPRLGKYHRSFCLDCGIILTGAPPQSTCYKCGGSHIVMGVYDRLSVIKDQESIHPEHRGKYIYNIPLEYIPKIGAVTRKKLYDRFHSEIYVLHKASLEELQDVIGAPAENIIKARNGAMSVISGGGGIYGKMVD